MKKPVPEVECARSSGTSIEICIQQRCIPPMNCHFHAINFLILFKFMDAKEEAVRPQIVVTIIGACSFASAAYAQDSGTVPDAVIEECMAQNDASELPNCLKEGGYGYQMLQLAGGEDFYGSQAAPVIDSCRSLNDTIQGAWTCFRVAAEASVETRGLIGLDKMPDQCVAAISDPEILSRLNAKADEQRKVWFPDEMFSGGNMYQPFRECASQ